MPDQVLLRIATIEWKTEERRCHNYDEDNNRANKLSPSIAAIPLTDVMVQEKEEACEQPANNMKDVTTDIKPRYCVTSVHGQQFFSPAKLSVTRVSKFLLIYRSYE